MTSNNIYYNAYAVAAIAFANGSANLYMRNNTVTNNDSGIFANASYATVNADLLSNSINNNYGTGFRVRMGNNASVNAYLRSNALNSNVDGVDARANGSNDNLNLTALYNQFSNNTSFGVFLNGYGNSGANAFLRNNSIVSNTQTGLQAISIGVTASRNFIANNNSVGLAIFNSSSLYVNPKNNIISGNYYGLFASGAVTVNPSLNTFNNTTNIAGGATFVTDDNWWPGGENYTPELDSPLLCTATVAGSTVTVTAASASTYFVDKVGAAPIRLTMTVDGVAATGVAVAAGQTSVTGTAAWATSSSAIVVTNAGGQTCTVTPVVVVASGGGGSSNSPPYDATGGGTDWLEYPLNEQIDIPTNTVLKWVELSDSNGDQVTYTLYLCHKDNWDSDTGTCSSWIVITGIVANGGAATAGVALAANGMATAGGGGMATAGGGGMATAGGGGMATAGGAMLFAIGFIGAIRSRKGRAFMMALMMIASAGMIASCSTDDSTESADEATTYTVCDDEAGIICEDIESSYTLDANTEYHWFVNAADGNGGSTNSGVRSFTTGSQ